MTEDLQHGLSVGIVSVASLLSASASRFEID